MTCSVCGNSGHNSRTCQKNNSNDEETNSNADKTLNVESIPSTNSSNDAEERSNSDPEVNSGSASSTNSDAASGATDVLWVKFDNLTPQEAKDLLKGAIDLKEAIAPNARGTFARGKRSEMPKKIAEALQLSSDGDKDEKK